MSDSIQFNLIGIDSLLGKLEAVTHDVKYKGGRFALRKAAQVIRDQAKRNAERIDDPETGRKIADNIAERWGSKRFRATGDLSYRIGVLTGTIRQMERGNPDTGIGGATPHAMLVELGTEKTQAQPYLRKAADQATHEALNTFCTEYEKALDRAIKRANKSVVK